MRKAILALAASVACRRLYRLYATGAITVDLGVGSLHEIAVEAERRAAP